jgi:hypothetical protein
MKKVNGENIYYSQKNNAFVEVFQDYFFREYEKVRGEATGEVKKTLDDLRRKIFLHVTCFPTSMADGIHSCGWPMDIFPPGLQPEDGIMCILNNPVIAKKLHQGSRYVPPSWAYNEIPDYYPTAINAAWGNKQVCKFERNITIQEYSGYIDHGYCIAYAHPGHVIIGKGYDIVNGKTFRVYNDPYRKPKMIEPAKTLAWGVVIFPFQK